MMANYMYFVRIFFAQALIYKMSIIQLFHCAKFPTDHLKNEVAKFQTVYKVQHRSAAADILNRFIMLY